MSNFFDFDHDIVYAPGATCVYNQLFHGAFRHPWKAYQFLKLERGFRLYDEPATVIGNLFRGETERSASLFAEPDRFLTENADGPVTYDLLAVESRWLTYGAHLFDRLDWADLAARLRPFHDRRLVFIDCDYPHYGYLQNIRLVRQISADELEDQRRWQDARHRLLEVFSAFRQFRYLAVEAVVAYHGYRDACMDQPDHYTPAFRDRFRQQLLSHSEDRQLTNTLAFVAVEDAVTGRETEIELIAGMAPTFRSGDTVLKLRVRIKPEDPLQCDTEMIATWTARTDGVLAWRQNFTVDAERMVRPIDDGINDNNPRIVLKSFDDLIKISTLGQYEFVLTR